MPPPPPLPGMNVPPPVPNLTPAAPQQSSNVEYPQIGTWLMYCDRHPARSGENFNAYAQKFSDEGYRRINQLIGARISVEKLATWLGIGKGTADLLIQYAEEDVELVKAGSFVMA
jgi:hypothetical protein